MRATSIALTGLLAISLLAVPTEGASWKAGVARANITPTEYMPMAGYASRGREPAHGKQTELWAKACVLEPAEGDRVALITLDLVGIDRELSRQICDRLKSEYGLQREQIAINTSHTHSGPVVQGNLRPMYATLLTDADQSLVQRYADQLQVHIASIVGDAIKNLAPAELDWGSGTATFAVNRRNNPEKDVPQLRETGQLKGPVDHAVPVLRIRREGKPIAVLFGYACHNTTLSGFEWSGDYAGYAQIELERMLPGCQAMYWAGCGADQNPIPRRNVELAEKYGLELAQAVKATVDEPMQVVPSQLTARYAEIPLPFDSLPSRETLEQDAKSSNVYVAARAQSLLAELEAGQPLSPTYPYPVSSWRLGNDIHWVFLGGEVVVDFVNRIKQERGNEAVQASNVWVAGYTHDVMAYIPSRRVLTEGGYEGGGAMVYYGLPSPWGPDVEELILDEVNRQLK